MKHAVHLGFEVGTGEPVEIPIAGRHMVITGQTQLSGKTTTLEALIKRSGVRALAFRTKRGEGAFGVYRGSPPMFTLPPYFRDRTDWQFVESIMESTMRQRMKFERAWIVKACRGAKTLADVRANVTTLMKKATRSMDQDIFMLLGEYLDLVVPVLAKLPPAGDVKIRPGLNVVDLEAYPVEVQALVIASMLAWVYERERDVACVLPESWKFIPQGRNSPVLMAAIGLAREGAGIGNRLWIDSQDIAGAEKQVIRQATIWLLGVQREANEMKRTLEHIPAGIRKPKAEDIATLERGQFFACWDKHAIKTYVQPAWMDEDHARLVAMGKAPATPAVAEIMQAPLRPRAAPTFNTPERIRVEIACEEVGTRGAGHETIPVLMPVRAQKVVPPSDPQTDWGGHAILPGIPFPQPTNGDDMTPDQERKLDHLLDLLTADKGRGESSTTAAETPTARRRQDATPAHFDEDALVARIIDRIKREAPKALAVMAKRPELEVHVEIERVQVDGKTLRGRLAQLISEGWFKEVKAGNAAFQELQRRGFSTAKPNVYRELDGLAEMGFVTKEPSGGYLEVGGMKVNILRK